MPGPRVLDLGVGPGESALAPRPGGGPPIGLDRSMAVLRRATLRSRARGLVLPLLRADAACLPVRTGALDGATGHSILYLLDDPAAALRELRRAVRPGGRVAFLEPCGPRPGAWPAWRRGPRFGASMALWGAMSRLHRRFDAAGLAALLAEAGFLDVRIEPDLRGFALLGSARR